MTTTVYALSCSLVFPAGLAPGEESQSNRILVARNGKGNPVLRGSSLAGVLRNAWRQHLGVENHAPDITALDKAPEVTHWFGASAEHDGDVESRLWVSDCILDTGQTGADATERTHHLRTHHLRDRHLGRVADGGLFGLEACPPGTTTSLVLWLTDDHSAPAGIPSGEDLLQGLAAALKTGLLVGGNSNRGIGLAELEGEVRVRRWNRADLDACADLLDTKRAWLDKEALPGGEVLERSAPSSTQLRISLALQVPRGQDILVGDGQGLDAESEPQRVTAADGQDYWRLPGSSLRGLFRSYITHLAAREGKTVADSLAKHRKRKGKTVSGDALGWLFQEKEDGKRVAHPELHDTHPVASLFGSLHKAGRLHIADAFCKVSQGETEKQKRMHVAVDAISGGAVEHLLFDNFVLTAPASFDVTVLVDNPTDDDARWLAQSIRALDAGYLRVGSSKSAGRLELGCPPAAIGPQADAFLAACQGAEKEA